MLLTLTAERDGVLTDPADLGFVLHKYPGRAQEFAVSTGRVHVLWPAVGPERAEVAVLLEVDPIGLVRGGSRRDDSFALSHYVNDRPYAAGSLLAVALARVFGTAMAGRCDSRPELATARLPLRIGIPALSATGGPELVRRLFEPLGWTVTAEPIPLDDALPEWGTSRYAAVTLAGTCTVADALRQLYVLLPVLDDGKHYWVSSDEVDKLLRAGGDWLAAHPERELITRRYLSHQSPLVATALSRLAEVDDAVADELDDAPPDEQEPALPLAVQRRQAVLRELEAEGAATVVDIGCGQGALLADLMERPVFSRVLGVEVSARALAVAARRLRTDQMSERQRARLELVQSSVTYRDDRLAGFDAAVLMEVVEHLDLPRLPSLERTVFGAARPISVLVTTPNADYNVRYEGLRRGQFRHRDHRFEWTRAQFQDWAGGVATAHGYSVRHLGIGDTDPDVGAPTQLAVFRRPT